jgi:hypothetical protein
MAGQFFENFRILVAKVEDTQGTMVTPTSADFKQKIRNISVSPSVDMDPNKYQTGHHGEADAVSGKQFGTVSFEVLMAWGGAVTTAPNYALFDYACGQYPHTYAGTGLALHPLKAYDENTITIWVYDIQAGATPGAICYKFAGCVGNCQIGVDGVGKPIIKKYTFTGKLVDIDFNVAYASIPVLADLDATCTDKALLTTVEIDSNERLVSSFSLDYGNEVTALEDMSDATGISHYSITKRAPRLTLNPLFQLNLDDYNYLNSGATGCADTFPVTIAANHFTITVPKARLSAGSVAARDGRIGMDMTFDCLFNGVTGAYADTGMLGDSGIVGEATVEVLQGARS